MLAVVLVVLRVHLILELLDNLINVAHRHEGCLALRTLLLVVLHHAVSGECETYANGCAEDTG